MNFQLAFILSLTSAIAYSMISILMGKVAKVNGSYWTSFWIQVFGLAVTALFIPFFGLNLTFDMYLLPILVFSIGIFFTFIIYMKCLSIGPIPVVQSILRIGSLITFVIAIFFLGETVNTAKVIGAILVILGVILVSINIAAAIKKQLKMTKALPLALLQASINGVIFIFLTIAIKHYDGFSANIATRSMVVPLFLLSATVMKKPDSNFFKNSWKILLLIAFVDSVAFILFTLSIKLYQVSLVAIMQSTFPVITAIILTTFFKEKLTMSQKAGIIITFFGSILMAYSR